MDHLEIASFKTEAKKFVDIIADEEVMLFMKNDLSLTDYRNTRMVRLSSDGLWVRIDVKIVDAMKGAD